MSHQWIPSNGTEGHQFINDWRAIDEAMRQAAELGNGVGIMK
jgi:hypothetical protein